MFRRYKVEMLDESFRKGTYPGIFSKYNPVMPLHPVKDGCIEAPEAPGLGIDIDPKDVAKYRIN